MSDAQQLAMQASQLDPGEYQVFLDQLAEKRKNQFRSQLAENPEDKSRDSVAKWIAFQHLATDPGITDVWYLPHNAPEEEIRLIEVNHLLRGVEDEETTPIDFGLDIEGINFKLLVLDVKPGQFENLKRRTLPAPDNWSFENAQHYSTK